MATKSNGVFSPTTITTSIAECYARTPATKGILPLVHSPFTSTPKFGFSLSLQHRKVNKQARKLIIRAARMESAGVSLGFRAPHFELPEPLTGKIWKLDDFESHPALLVLRDRKQGAPSIPLLVGWWSNYGNHTPNLQKVAMRILSLTRSSSGCKRNWSVFEGVMFICNHCPFVKHLKKDIVKISDFYMKKGLGVVAISSNSVLTHPQDGPEFMAEDAKFYKYPFPYLYDESQDVARAFGAVCTPEFFLYKKDGRRPFELVYHGQFDDSRPSNNLRVTGRDLSMAIDCVLSFQPVKSDQKPSVGCSIKWHPVKEK